MKIIISCDPNLREQHSPALMGLGRWPPIYKSEVIPVCGPNEGVRGREQ